VQRERRRGTVPGGGHRGTQHQRVMRAPKLAERIESGGRQTRRAVRSRVAPCARDASRAAADGVRALTAASQTLQVTGVT
jgi:hypothetical protein